MPVVFLESLEGRLGWEPDPSSPGAIIQADWQTIEGHPDTREDPPVKAQVEFVGAEFRKGADGVLHAGKSANIPVSKHVRIVAGDGNGLNYYQEAADVKRFHPSELPHRPLRGSDNIYDAAHDSPPTLKTVRRKGASRVGYNTHRSDAHPSVRIPKPPESFLFHDAPAALKKRLHQEKQPRYSG